ncbi:MFS transporter [Okibacterium endophyticum]
MTDTKSVPPSGGHIVDAKEARRVVVSSAVGTTIEFYDFTLYGLASVLVFGPQFFPSDNPVAAQLGALATFAAGFIVRPLGGVIGGHFGDRIGRKRVLIASFMTMGIVTLAIAFLPTFAVIGVAAPIILVLLRMLQGLAAGAEWGGAALMAVEHAPRGKRGLYGAAPAFGTTTGTILAYGVILLVAQTAPEAFVTFGWRIAFALSFVLIIFGFFVRRRVTESPLFEEAMRNEPPRVPLLTILRRHPVALIRGMSWVLIGAALGYTISPYSVGYAVETFAYDRNALLLSAVAGLFVMLAALLIASRYLDGKTRRLLLIIAAVIQIPSAILFFPLLSLENPVTTTLAYCIGLGTVGIINGTLGSVLADQFPVDVGYTGVALSYNLAYAIGGCVPLVAAAILASTGSIAGLVVILAIIAAIAIPVALSNPRNKAAY